MRSVGGKLCAKILGSDWIDFGGMQLDSKILLEVELSHISCLG